MGDVIREFESGAKDGEPMRFGPQNVGSPSEIDPPFRLTPLSNHFVMGRKSPIETIVNGILHRPYGKSLSGETFRPPFPSISRRRVHQQSCSPSYGHKKKTLRMKPISSSSVKT
jgi:hypothetical protein